MSAVLIHDKLQTTFPLSDVVINESPWTVACSATLQHDLLLQMIDGVKLPELPVVVETRSYMASDIVTLCTAKEREIIMRPLN